MASFPHALEEIFSCSGIIHGEIFKYEFVFLLLCHHFGAGRPVYPVQSSLCAVHVPQELVLGQWGVFSECRWGRTMEENCEILTCVQERNNLGMC